MVPNYLDPMLHVAVPARMVNAGTSGGELINRARAAIIGFSRERLIHDLWEAGST